METRYTVELTLRHKYYNWDDLYGYMMFSSEPSKLRTNTEIDDDYLMAVF